MGNLLCLVVLLGLTVILQAAPAQGQGPKPVDCRALELKNGFIDASFVETTAHKAVPASDESVIRVDTDLVVAEFDVRDKKGKRVSGLGVSDFKIEEDGVEQAIEVFSYGKASSSISRSIILIIDYSQSQLPYIETSIEAAKVLVDMLEPSDRMALVTDDIELLLNFSSDKALLKERLDSLKFRALEGKVGRSRQLTALYAAVSELFARDDKRPVVILQSDGDEFAELALWPRHRGQRSCPGTAGSFADLQDALEKAGTTVYSVIPGIRIDGAYNTRFGKSAPDLETQVRREAKMKRTVLGNPQFHYSKRALKIWEESRLRDAAAIERISEQSGGITQYLDSPERAAEVYRRVLDEMNQRYLIGYYPSNKNRDGRKRAIRVNLRSTNGYLIVGKSSYTPGF
jgi:VWFA-related protein